jgi:NAD(P)-dependent dehydrogenase (short-subunit alcohol dehydrogenase family)
MAEIRFDEQVIVVTGSGRGLGRAYAVEFGRRGGSVVVNSRTGAEADAVVAEIEAAGGRAVANHDSVATAAGGAALVRTALDAFGAVDVLVNNAGGLAPAYFQDMTLEQLDSILDTHLRGMFFVTQPAWRAMKERGYGRIILTSSGSGLFGHHGVANYAAAKAGAYGLMKALAYEGVPLGITCNAIVPHAATTIHHGNPIPDMLQHRIRGNAAPDRFRADRTSPTLVAAIVAYLASRECAITGEAFSAVSGRFARVFVGVTDGWLETDPRRISSETVRDHIDEIRDLGRHSVPRWLFDEQAGVLDRMDRAQERARS